ncbi:MAG TPA: AAA family ATPase [Kofleriaceae bacterium]|nr:AAA family ATPase [Kofleriaceae bacterium]
MTAALDPDHPWPGPASFRTQDAAFFHGRDAEVDQLQRLLRRARAVVLYAASGLGKTSLINAGLIPALDRDAHFAVPIRISYVAGAPPVGEQIQAEIVRARGRDDVPEIRADRTAWEYLHRRDAEIAGAQPLLIFDQFEELFTLGRGTPQAAQLVEELQGLIEDVPPASVRARLDRAPDEARQLAFRRVVRVVISIREDFLYGLEALRNALPSIIHNRYRLAPLDGRAALAVAGASGLIAPDVAELVVRTVAATVSDDRPLEALEVEPALLSILCSELARRRAPGAPITAALVTGNRADILSSFYERALRDMPDGVRTYIEDELVTATGFRTSAVVAEALAVPGVDDDVLGELVNRRLLRVIDRPSGKWIELSHDLLTEVAAKSRAVRQERARQLAELSARAEQARREREAREATYRSRRNTAILGFVAVTAVLLLFVELYRSERAGRQVDNAHHQQYEQSRETDYQNATRLREANAAAKRVLRRQFIAVSLREQRYPQAVAQLAAALDDGNPAYAGVHHTASTDLGWATGVLADLVQRHAWPIPAAPMFPPGAFTSLACNQARTRCAAAYRDGTVVVAGDLARTLSTGEPGNADVVMSDDGARLLFLPNQIGHAVAWDLTVDPPARHELAVADAGTTWSTSGDGATVVLPRSNQLVVWQLAGAAPTATTIERRYANAPFVLSRDAAWLAYQRDRTTIEIDRLGDRAGGAPLCKLAVDDAVATFTVDPASQTLLVSEPDGRLRRWLVPGCGELPALRAARRITKVQLDATGDHMVLLLEGGGVELWSAPWRAPRELVQASHGVLDVSFAPHDPWLAITTPDGVTTWDFTGAPLGEPVFLGDQAFAAARDHGELIAVSLAGATGRWIVPAPAAPREVRLATPIVDAWLTADGFYAYGKTAGFAHSGGTTREERLFHTPLWLSHDRAHSASAYVEGVFLRDGLPTEEAFDAGREHLLVRGLVDDVGFSLDGTRVAVIANGAGHVFETATGRALGAPIPGVTAMWLSDDGALIATTGNNAGLTLWKLTADGARAQIADIPVLVTARVTFSHKGDQLVIATAHRARIWRLIAHDFVGPALAHDGPITDVEFSPDDRWIVTASEDRRAQIWDADSGLPASDRFAHAASVIAASFAPSGRQLLTASRDGVVKIWDLAQRHDAGGIELGWLARTGELLSGMHVDPATSELAPLPAPFTALSNLRAGIARHCPGRADDPAECRSATRTLIDRVLDQPGAEPSRSPKHGAGWIDQ